MCQSMYIMAKMSFFLVFYQNPLLQEREIFAGTPEAVAELMVLDCSDESTLLSLTLFSLNILEYLQNPIKHLVVPQTTPY